MKLGVGLMALLIVVVVKGAVMILTARLLWKIHRSRPPTAARPWLQVPAEHLPAIALLEWSLVFFAVSELTCAVEIYLLHESSPLLGGIHSLTSALGMALFGLSLYQLFDRKFFRYGKPACLANRICRGCTIETPAGCRFRPTLVVVAGAVLLAAVPAFVTPTAEFHSDGSRYMLPFESWNLWYDRVVEPWLIANTDYDPDRVAYYMPETIQVIEWRLLPAAALGLALVAIVLLLRAREALGIKTLVFAAGLLGFAYFQLILYRGTGDIIFGALGHEAGELWFLVATAELLRSAFAPSPASAEAVA